MGGTGRVGGAHTEPRAVSTVPSGPHGSLFRRVPEARRNARIKSTAPESHVKTSGVKRKISFQSIRLPEIGCR